MLPLSVYTSIGEKRLRLFPPGARHKRETSGGHQRKGSTGLHPRMDLVRLPLFRSPVSPGYSWTGVSLIPAPVIAMPVAVWHSQEVYRFTRGEQNQIVFGHPGDLRAFLSVAYAFHT